MDRHILFAACVALAPFAAMTAAAPPGHAAQFKTLYKFVTGSNTEGVSGELAVLDNVLYGATGQGGIGPESDGTIFKFDLATQTKTTLVNFTGVTGNNKGQAPTGKLSVVGHTIYGSTDVGGMAGNESFGNGEIWELNARSGTEQTFYAFDGTDGFLPTSGVTPVGGMFYGTTDFGGPTNTGTVFELDATGKLTDVYTFPDSTVGCNPTTGIVVVGKFLYGTTSACGAGGGSVFSLNLATGQAQALHFFAANNQQINNPQGLIARASALYGTTFDDGGSGTVYKIGLGNHQYTLLHQFGGTGDGSNPVDGLTWFKGLFYGVTQGGGASGHGTIYSFDPSTGHEAVVYSFTGGSDGDSPGAALLAHKGVLYGSTLNTDTDNQGTLFDFVP